MKTLKAAQKLYPPDRTKNEGHTGRIPIAEFDKHEAVMRPWMSKHNLRAMYRGPRIKNSVNYFYSNPSMTRRCDATHVILYWRTDRCPK